MSYLIVVLSSPPAVPSLLLNPTCRRSLFTATAPIILFPPSHFPRADCCVWRPLLFAARSRHIIPLPPSSFSFCVLPCIVHRLLVTRLSLLPPSSPPPLVNIDLIVAFLMRPLTVTIIGSSGEGTGALGEAVKASGCDGASIYFVKNRRAEVCSLNRTMRRDGKRGTRQ